MIRRALYLGLAVVSAWQFVSAVNRYRIASSASRRKLEQRGAVSTWEGEGGNPAPVRRKALRH